MLGSCTDQFEDWNEVSEFCYKQILEKKSWYDAKDSCESLKGELVVVHSESVMTSILEHTQDARDGNQDIWIGLKKDAQGDGTLTLI